MSAFIRYVPISIGGGGGSVTQGDLTDVGTDGIVITGGTGAVIGSGTQLAQHVADATHNGYLSSVDWNTFNNKQSALTLTNITDVGTDGIVITNGTGAVIGASPVTLAQHVADSTHNGYLSSADWSTFNGKQAAGNYITALTGDVTASGPGSAVATLAASIAGTHTFSGAITFSAASTAVAVTNNVTIGGTLSAGTTDIGSSADNVLLINSSHVNGVRSTYYNSGVALGSIGSAKQFITSGNLTEFGIGSVNALNFSVANGLSALFIDTDGRAGVGTKTPLVNMDVIGPIWSRRFGGPGECKAGSANGSLASPTASQVGDQIGNFGAFGYGTTDWTAASTASMRMIAAQNFTDSAQGTEIDWYTTPNNTASAVLRMTLTQGGLLNIAGLTASQAIFTDGSKNLVSNAITGSGNVVMSTSPVLVTPNLGTPTTLVGTNITGTAAGLTAGSVTTNANLTGVITSVGNATSTGAQTGTGSTFMMSASPTTTGTLTAAAANFSGALTGASSLVLGTSGGTRGSIDIVGTAAAGPKLEFDGTAGSGGKDWLVGDGLSVAFGTFEIRNNTDSKVVYQSDANGNTQLIAKLGVIGAAGVSDQASVTGTTTLTGVTQRGMSVLLTGTSAGTTALTGFHAALTSAASTTVALTTGYRSAAPVVGSSGTMTRFNGFYDTGAQQHLATNNAAFADNAAYTGNFFINNSVADPSIFAGAHTLSNLAGTGTRTVLTDSVGLLSAPVSDSRLKKDVIDLNTQIDPVEAIKALKGVLFHWDTTNERVKNHGPQQEIGMIAQDVEKIIPQAVRQDKDGWKSLDYSHLVPLLIEVIKIQQNQIDSILAKIEERK